MTDILMELTRNAYYQIGREIYVGVYDTDAETYEIRKDIIRGLEIKNGRVFFTTQNNEHFEDRYLDSESLEIDIYERIGAICFSAYSKSLNIVKEQMEKINYGMKTLGIRWGKGIKLNPISDMCIDTLEEYYKRNGREFNINVFIEESFHMLKNADKDFEEFYKEYLESYEDIE